VKSAAYKEITLQQLRSFCATARQGSLTAAAAALQLAQPTVWKQVHVLEQAFGSKLVEPHARGCRLTEAGEVLRRLLEPAVASLDLGGLQARFAEELGRINIHITVAGQSRLLADDLPTCLAAFVPHWPRARFTLRPANGDEIAGLVESGEASLGFTTFIENRGQYPHLSFEAWYELEVILLTPHDHPLAKQRRVRPEDLKPYPLINAATALRDTQAHGTLVKLGLYQTEPRWVEARYVSLIRPCVERGLGIALVPGLWPRQADPRLHERVMRRYFGPIPVYLVRHSGVNQHATVCAFAEEVRCRLAPRRKRANRERLK
jgi:DNA-binding transcriptional LysR family regulator